MTITLPSLPYQKHELEPFIDKETLEYHYEKHHRGYVNKLNGLIVGTQYESNDSVRSIMETAEGPIYNNAAQIWNHTFYWNCMCPNGGGEPSGSLKVKIDECFGSFDKFKEQFSAAASGHFGSGWAWLILDKEKKLKVTDTHDAGNPLRDKCGTPLLTCDVWEHAYYIGYRNDRAKYINNWWNVVNWKFVETNFDKAISP